MTTALEGYRFERRLAVEAGEDYVLLFSRKDRPAQLAAWTTGARRAVSMPARLGSEVAIQGVNLDGTVMGIKQQGSAGGADEWSLTAAGATGQTVRLGRSRLTVDLDQHPLYLRLEGVRLEP